MRHEAFSRTGAGGADAGAADGVLAVGAGGAGARDAGTDRMAIAAVLVLVALPLMLVLLLVAVVCCVVVPVIKLSFGLAQDVWVTALKPWVCIVGFVWFAKQLFLRDNSLGNLSTLDPCQQPKADPGML